MIFLSRILIVFLLAVFFLPVDAHGEATSDAITHATAAIEAATPRAQADPAHPSFHVTAPAQWINDPNGPIYYKGFYHLFYQLNPFSDESGPKYWGHVRSRDLVKWEPLPIALWPSTNLGEVEVWSGCCTINGSGEPMIFYTSIARDTSPQDHAEQWAAIGDDHLIDWRKLPSNPVLTEALHGSRKIYDWRDPFVFHDKRKTFLVTGGNLNRAGSGQAVVNIYEAQNAALTQWKYRGVLFQDPDPQARTAECPNFFKLGDQWVLFFSPYGKVQYFVGDFDAETCRFHPRTQGVLDFGPNFYAPNTMQVPDGRRLVWGWVTGFPGGHGWNGCLSLPRLLSLSRDGQLQQSPAPQLKKLRCTPMEWRNVHLDNSLHPFILPTTNTLEISTEIDLQSAQSVALEMNGRDKDTSPIVVNFNGSELRVMDAMAPLKFSGNERKLKLRIFIDRSVLEVFANETVCITKVISLLPDNAILQVRADGGTATANRIEVWPIKTIW
jgi:beta-fructofuranosidase